MRDVDFVNNIIIALSNEETTKIKVVHLEKLYNFVVQNFLVWIHLLLKNVIWIYLCRVFFVQHSAKNWHSAKGFFAGCIFLLGVFCVALGKWALWWVPDRMHSAKSRTLGQELVSGSGFGYCDLANCNFRDQQADSFITKHRGLS